ncbi:dephospho-CoA kinase [Streptococcus himalayensis]|uniref:Dephospho-CoA kinase n=1 Tax=Streptococcus himalayensis TaxID=1888195 RepID=A0A917EDJ4_9STRE|nr:dephospho-CoA kinase [Streptococcus himalayensis]GGE27625.1 dephospho-CoA kinase [Streptococcus himalayensis]
MTRVIGLTGGIASGKSTVTAYLRKRGYQVIDADEVVHTLQQKGGKLYQALLQEYGPNILLPNQELDRGKLAAVVFANEESLERTNRLQQAIIREELASLKAQHEGSESLLFMDIPLLFELNYEQWFEEIWLVGLSKSQQVERLMARNRLSQEEAEKRIAAQLSLAEKRQRASSYIDNSGSVKQTYAQIDRLLQELERR